jgi:hypothetical protein
MICRPEGDGWLLISQPAHAWLAGKFAAAWGNGAFARPIPFESVIMATRLHDIGWLPWDAAPRLDEQGRPVNFLETTLDETIPIWRRAVEQLILLDPYAAILVSMHATTIYRRRLERGVDPPERRPEVEATLLEQESIQKELRAQIANHPIFGPAIQPELLETAYRWLRVCDLLSLAVCANFMPPKGSIAEVPGKTLPGFTTIRYKRLKPFELHLDPSPFSDTTMKLVIQARFLKDKVYESQAAYWTALKRSPWVSRTITILAA